MQTENALNLRRSFRGNVYPWLAVLFCVLLGSAIIVNVQLAGDAEWFWYATFFHQGVKLYAGMHMALQPLFVMEADCWMMLFGRKCIPYESLALLHVLAMSVGLLLVMRESHRPGWQKALFIAGCFPIIIHFGPYRFDDFHIVADTFKVYSLVALLMMARAKSAERELALAAVLGVLSGLATMIRLTDGAALMLGAAICVAFLARRRRSIATGIFLLLAALTVIVVVHLTGDTFHDYAANSIFRAASAKGGTGTIFHGPLVGLRTSFAGVRHGGKAILVGLGLIAAAGAAMKRYWQSSEVKIVWAQIGIAAAVFVLCTREFRSELLNGLLIDMLSKFIQPLIYLILLMVVVRWLRSTMKRNAAPWDAREMLILLAVGELLACSLSQANGTSDSYLGMAMLLLLVAVIEPWGSGRGWASASFAAIVMLVGLTGATSKILVPYSWFSNASRPMFEDRVWYQHPLYGTMYLDRDLPAFIEPICRDIQQGNAEAKPELLTLPYPYPNYFCGIPPWHHYVQTWFDTVPPSTIVTLMNELNAAPPQWVLYQRQLEALQVHEMIYNHNQPIAHRALDEMIMQKIATGQWKLVSKSYYEKGDGWFLIQTHP